VLALVPVTVAAAFLPTLGYPFTNWDDGHFVVRNPLLGPLMLERFLAMWTRPLYFNYYPLTLLSLWLDHHLFGMQPWGFRLTNIALHAGTCLALSVTLWRSGVEARWAALLGLAFGLHPLRAESVVWITERKDILCAFFFLWAVQRWMAPGEFGRARAAQTAALGAAALLSKAMAVSLGPLLLLRAMLFAKERTRPRLAAAAVLTAGSALASLANLAAQDPAIRAEDPLPARLLVAGWSPVHYAWTTLAPFWLSPLYPRESFPAAELPLAALALAVPAGLLALAWRWRKARPELAFAILGAGLVLGPVSGIVGIGSIFAADRYSYLPTAILLIGAAPSLLAGDWAKRRVAFLAGGALVATLGAGLMLTVPRWADSRSLWNSVLAHYPDAVEARRGLANAIVEEAALAKDGAVRLRLMEEALAVSPGEGEALQAVASQRAAAGDRDGALALYRRGIADPATRLLHRAMAHVSLVPLVPEPERAAALAAAREALKPENAQPAAYAEYLYAGWLAEQAGAMDLAEQYYTRCVRMEPTNPEGLGNLAYIRIRQRRFAEARDLLRAAVAANPDHRPSAENLARLERQMRGS
jgi:tetratricopeptide (TPR) repeat protein